MVQVSPLRTHAFFVPQAAVVPAGDDRVPDPGGGAVLQRDLASGGEGAVEDEVGAGSRVEGGDIVAGLGDHHRDQPLIAVGAPSGIGSIAHRFGVAVVDAVMVQVGVDDLGAAVAQCQGGGLLPGVVEPVDVDQLGNIVPVVDKREKAPPASTD